MKILKVKKNSEIGIQLAGTKVVKGYKIVLFSGDTDETILADSSKPVKQGKLLPFFLPVPKISKSGKVTGESAMTNLKDKLQCFAGKRWEF